MHKNQKPLRLRKETLRQLGSLNDDQLRQVNGGKRAPNSAMCTTEANRDTGLEP